MIIGLRIEMSAEASQDVLEQTAWHDAERVGLGAEFVHAVDATLEQISETPNRFPFVYRDVRRALTDRFHFALPFRVMEDRIVVLGVIHTARHPKVLRRRARGS